jgi:hypothetical protein
MNAPPLLDQVAQRVASVLFIPVVQARKWLGQLTAQLNMELAHIHSDDEWARTRPMDDPAPLRVLPALCVRCNAAMDEYEEMASDTVVGVEPRLRDHVMLAWRKIPNFRFAVCVVFWLSVCVFDVDYMGATAMAGLDSMEEFRKVVEGAMRSTPGVKYSARQIYDRSRDFIVAGAVMLAFSVATSDLWDFCC